MIEKTAASLDAWCLDIEGTVEDIRLEVGKLSKHWERTLRDGKSVEPPLIASPLPSAAGRAAELPNRHRVDLLNREGDHGVVTTVVHPPGKGTFSEPPPPFHSHQPSRFDARGTAMGLGVILWGNCLR